MQPLKLEMKKKSSYMWLSKPERNKLITRKGNLYMMTRNVNLPSFTRIQYVMTRTVKKPQMSICGQWSQQKNQVICSQWPDQEIRSQLNQPVTRNCCEKNCQATRCYKENNLVFDDRNCQSTQYDHMQTAMKSSNMQLPKPAVPYKYTRLCSNKNCQSTRCFKKKYPVRQFVMTRTVNLPNICIKMRNVLWNLVKLIFFLYVVSAKDCLQIDGDTAWNS